jgi:hypothetical protein
MTPAAIDEDVEQLRTQNRLLLRTLVRLKADNAELLKQLAALRPSETEQVLR